MLKKIWIIFSRDLKISSRDFLGLYILVLPVLLALGINALAPSVNDTTVHLALLEGDNPDLAANLEQYARIDLFASVDQVTTRVQERDNVIAILPAADSYYILAQGNEPEGVVDIARMLKTFVELDLQVDESSAEIVSFGRTEPPLKKMLVNLSILLTSVLAGMLIAINIVEEKVDNTVSAINVSPISRQAFILGKSLIGMFLSIYGAVAIVWITGFGHVNLGQLLLAIAAATVITVLIGFIQGINNDDVMNAAAGIKMLFLPLAAGVAAAELLSDKWQVLAYWIPFYWTYKGNDAILSCSASWPQILLYTAIVLAISSAVYVYLAPKIQKGLA